MSTVNTIENLRLWFLTCPRINRILEFNADYLGTKPTECSIYSSPSRLSYTEDLIGNITFDKRQILYFYLAIRLPYGGDVEQNLDNLDLFTEVQEWMYEQNLVKNFPEISEGEAVSIMPVKTAYLTNADADSAIYEIQCTLSYDRSE